MKSVQTDKAPKAIGPYSQAVVAGDLVFCAGQVAIDPETNELVAGGVKRQTEQTLRNLEVVLVAAGAKLEKVVSVNVYLASMKDFQAMNEVYAQFFGTHKPARATVGVSELPKKARVEIACIATLK